MSQRPIAPPVRIEADYLLETASDPRRVAETMAGEQSSGTFVPVRARRRNSRPAPPPGSSGWRCWTRPVTAPSLPTTAAIDPAKLRRASVTLSWPIENLGPSLPNLLATIAGNLFELRPITGLRLLDIRLPQAFADAYPGPRSGSKARAASRASRDGRSSAPSSSRASASGRTRPPPGPHPVRGRDRLHQGRRVAGRRAALPVRRPRPRRDAGRQRPCRAHGQGR